MNTGPAVRPSACRVRAAKAEDRSRLDAVIRLIHGDPGAYHFGISVVDVIDTDGHRVFIAFLGDELIGCVAVHVSTVAIIHNLGVVPEHRGSFHATTLIKEAITAVARDDGVDRFWTLVDPEVASAGERFRTLGFVEHDAQPIADMMLLRSLAVG